MIVIDASLVVDIITAKIDAGVLDNLSQLGSEEIVAPYLLDIEVLNALRKLHSSKKATNTECETALSLFNILPITRKEHTPLLARIWELRANMTAYDAAYVALAEKLNAELWTTDTKFSNTPNHTAKVNLISPAP